MKKIVKVVINLMVLVSAVMITKARTSAKVVTQVIVEKEEPIVIVMEKKVIEKDIAFNNANEKNIYNKAIEQGLTKEQAMLLISISRHETGAWTSKAFKNDNNFGGIMSNGGLKHYESYEEGLNDFVRILKTYYFEKGLNTIEEIGAKYCPVGAANDPNGLNKYWIGGVTNFYNYYLTLI